MRLSSLWKSRFVLLWHRPLRVACRLFVHYTHETRMLRAQILSAPPNNHTHIPRPTPQTCRSLLAQLHPPHTLPPSHQTHEETHHPHSLPSLEQPRARSRAQRPHRIKTRPTSPHSSLSLLSSHLSLSYPSHIFRGGLQIRHPPPKPYKKESVPQQQHTSI